MHTTVSAAIDAEVKAQAVRVLQREGLTLSQAIRALLGYIAREGKLPDDVPFFGSGSLPSTAEADESALPTYASFNELMRAITGEL
ncbi:MAG: type II toxin-antitoxin system RelB/DinJ family antitoxin [Paludibacterium sp.]|uniref:type II toxin-antitoxin system RelB/DinJ family antitoxin n=1 Tax=Paludibacterium sp. TaxID=1917523 RepID=UPI0025FDF393|nr:type II toxin-antitoxin system RelB/DinJ family antitoxin [Paludibacterium sp.]MBV8046933.1 type II toxin-antitoxin system RelB/DinJ family antitoxin [Paludibacterium sp.]MBV8646526.1 type II toxin-antitoxin system RelB/DinJ family antitoxin [Paludibacterium sp.]